MTPEQIKEINEAFAGQISAISPDKAIVFAMTVEPNSGDQCGLIVLDKKVTPSMIIKLCCQVIQMCAAMQEGEINATVEDPITLGERGH